MTVRQLRRALSMIIAVLAMAVVGCHAPAANAQQSMLDSYPTPAARSDLLSHLSERVYKKLDELDARGTTPRYQLVNNYVAIFAAMGSACEQEAQDRFVAKAERGQAMNPEETYETTQFCAGLHQIGTQSVLKWYSDHR
jgi:hypothetical protein